MCSTDPARTTSQRINEEIKKEKDTSKHPKNSNKDVLVIGDFCGLHEIIFQEVVLKGLTPEQTKEYSKKVHQFTLISMLHVIEMAIEREIEIKDIVAADQITSIGNCGILDSQLASYIKRLWKEPRIRALCGSDRRFANAVYFFEKIDVIVADNYVATHEDISYLPKIGGVCSWNYALVSSMDGRGQTLQFVDAMQNGGFKKWSHLFQDVSAVLFCVDLSKLEKLKYSMRIFEELSSFLWFSKTAFVIFFARKDLFSEKIANFNLQESFPAYNCGSDSEKALKFIESEFAARNKNKVKKIWFHYTSSLSTADIPKLSLEIIAAENEAFTAALQSP